MNTELFNAAIVNEEGIITNILVFDNEETMREFNAFPISDNQRIGDKYVAPKEKTIEDAIKSVFDEI